MSTETTINVLLVIASWVGVACAIYTVRTQVKESREQAARTLCVQLFQHYESDLMLAHRVRLAKSLLKNPNELEIDDTPLIFFETTASLALRGLVDEELAFDVFSYDITNYWAAVRHYIKHIREKCDDDLLFEKFHLFSEVLLRADMRRRANRSTPTAGIDKDVIKGFLEWEARRV